MADFDKLNPLIQGLALMGVCLVVWALAVTVVSMCFDYDPTEVDG